MYLHSHSPYYLKSHGNQAKFQVTGKRETLKPDDLYGAFQPKLFYNTFKLGPHLPMYPTDLVSDSPN